MHLVGETSPRINRGCNTVRVVRKSQSRKPMLRFVLLKWVLDLGYPAAVSPADTNTKNSASYPGAAVGALLLPYRHPLSPYQG